MRLAAFLVAAVSLSVSSAPIAPIVTTRIVDGNAELTWGALTAADGVCGYEIERVRGITRTPITTTNDGIYVDEDWQFGDSYYVTADECPSYSRKYISQIATPTLTCAEALTPLEGTRIDGTSATFTAAAHAGATLYDLYIGTDPENALFDDIANLPSNGTGVFNATGLPNDGSTIYVSLDVFNGTQQIGGYTCTYTSGEVAQAPAGCPITPDPAVTLTGTTQTFSWPAVSGAVLYDAFAGTGTTSGTIANIANGASGAGTSIELTGLPSDGSTFYVTRDAFISDGNGGYTLIEGAEGRVTCEYTAWTDTSPPPPVDPTILADNFSCLEEFANPTSTTKSFTFGTGSGDSTTDFNVDSGVYWYDYRSNQAPDETVFDQRGRTDLSMTYPVASHRWRSVIIGQSTSNDWCYSGGAFVGVNPIAMTWQQTKAAKNSGLETQGNPLIVEGARFHGIHDTITTTAAAPSVLIENTWATDTSDDFFEGYLHNITIRDSLIDGFYALFSDPDGSCTSTKNASATTAVIENSLIRLSNSPGPFGRDQRFDYEVGGGHGPLWKRDGNGCGWAGYPQFEFRNNIFLIEGPATSGYSLHSDYGGMALPGASTDTALSKITACENNLFMYTDYQDFIDINGLPGPLPKSGPHYNSSNPNYLPNGSDCFQMITDVPGHTNYAPDIWDIWFDATDDWIARHTGHDLALDRVMQIPGVDYAAHDGKTVTLQNVGTGRCMQSNGTGGIFPATCDGGADQEFDVVAFPRSTGPMTLRGSLLLRDYSGRWLKTSDNSVAYANENDAQLNLNIIGVTTDPANFDERWSMQSHAHDPSGSNSTHYNIQSSMIRTSYIGDDGDVRVQHFYEAQQSTPTPYEFQGLRDDSLRWIISEVGDVVAPATQVSWVSPANGSTLTSASPTFSWQNDDGNTQRKFDVKIATTAFPVGTYTTANVIYDTASLGSATNTSGQPPTLPTDGSTLYLRLSWSPDNGVWPADPQEGITAGRYLDLSFTAFTAASTLTEWNPDAVPLQAFGDLTTGELASIYGLTNNFADNIDNFATVTDTGETVMRVRFVPSAEGSERAQHGMNITGGPTVYQTEFDVLFESPFDPGGTNIGGKFGIGLAGGSHPSGGVGAVENGFSSSWMWRQNNGTVRAEIYTYTADMIGSFGTDRMTTYAIPEGEWVRFKMEVGLNTQGQSDGYLKGWINGVLYLDDTGIEWWGNSGTPQVDLLVNKNFHGGNDSTWSPSGTQYARFKNVRFGAP